MASIDISQIITEFGAYYRKGSQNVKDIRTKIFVGAESDELFTKIPTNDTRLDTANASIGSVLQGYQDAFTSKGAMVFTGDHIDLHPIKIDMTLNPTKIWNSWLGFLASNNLDRKEWPIVRYMIEKLVLPKADEEWELEAIYKGIKVTPTAGVATAPGAIINGIKSIINANITASKITPIVLGAVPTDPATFVTYVENLYAGIGSEVQPHLQQIAMSKTLERRFRTGMRAKYNVNYAQVDDIAKVIDTNIAVKGYRSHEGSTKIWTTIKDNAVMGIKHSGNESVFKIESAKRDVALFTDFWKGIGFLQPEYVFTNDVELPT